MGERKWRGKLDRFYREGTFCKCGISAAWSITKTHLMRFKETVPHLKRGSYRLSRVFRRVIFTWKSA